MAAWTNDESRRLRELHADGLSLRSCAKELGRPDSTVSYWAKKLKLSFDRSKTKKATEARVVDLKAKRVEIEQRLIDEAGKVIDQMWEPTVAFSFGGKDNVYTEHEIMQPTFGNQKDIMQTAAIALREANKLHEMNAGADSDGAKSALTQMHESLRLFAAEYEKQQGDGGSE